MKILVFVFLLLFANCMSSAKNERVGDSSSPIQPTVSPTAANTNSLLGIKYESERVDESKRNVLEKRNALFRALPEEFKNIDFKNFKYSAVQLKDGEYENFNPRKPTEGSQTFLLEDVFYIDLNGDAKKEAAVLLSAVSCGGSCDGGSLTIYFYTSENGGAKFLGEIETGSLAGGCALKSFSVVNKRITVEQFGRCAKDSTINANEDFTCKFCVKDLTQTIYLIEQNRLKKKQSFEIQSSETNVMGYVPEINLSD